MQPRLRRARAKSKTISKNLQEQKEVLGFKQGEIIPKHTFLVYCLVLELPHSKVYAHEFPEDWIARQTVLCAPCKLREMGNIFQFHHEMGSLLERGM